MTSANVIKYTIRDADNRVVGVHRQNVLCKTRWHELLKFNPLDSHTIQSWGYDEGEAFWEEEPVNLLKFLRGTHELKGKI